MTIITGTTGATGTQGVAPPLADDGANGGNGGDGGAGQAIMLAITQATILSYLANSGLRATSGLGGYGGGGSGANNGYPAGGNGGDAGRGGNGGELTIAIGSITLNETVKVEALGNRGGNGAGGGLGGNGLGAGGIGGAAGLSGVSGDSSVVALDLTDSVIVTAEGSPRALLDLNAGFAPGYNVGGYGRTGSSGETPGSGGAGGDGGTGGTATITVHNSWLSFDTGFDAHKMSVVGVLGGLGGDGGRGGAATGAVLPAGSYGDGGRGGNGGRGSDVRIVFTDNHLTGTDGDERLELNFYLNGGRGGVGGIGGNGGADLGVAAASGLNGASGSADLVISGNAIDGGAGVDTFALNIARGVYVDSTLGEVWEPGSVGEIRIDLAAGTWTVGGGVNTITNVENIYFSVENGLFVPGSPFLDMPLTVVAVGDAADNLFTASSWARAEFFGGAGNDTMFGRALDDHFEGGDGADDIDGFDGDDTLIGGKGDDFVYGENGNDRLDGGRGLDRMYGGSGDDTFVIDNVGDVVIEMGGEGNDTIETYFTAALGGNIENLTLLGSNNINATGDAGANRLAGNSGRNTLTGGAGDDTYYVQNNDDKVVEGDGQGVDIIYSAVSYNLTGRYVEILTLTGDLATTATGNGLANSLIGNNGVNNLTGLAGNDSLDGGAGADTLVGGTGDDTYVVDEAGDVITELNGQGTDVVNALVSYTLAAGVYVETLNLSGAANIDAIGNTLANAINGNDGNNIVNGAQGADTLAGGLGDDTYYVDNVGDRIFETAGAGVDWVRSTISIGISGQYIENIVLMGTTNTNATGQGLDNQIYGSRGNNTLNGSSGNDTLDGGKGADILIGGVGADSFVFTAGSGSDVINDFRASQGDTININAYTHGVTGGAVITQTGADAVIDLGGGNMITVLVASATASSFLSHIVW